MSDREIQNRAAPMLPAPIRWVTVINNDSEPVPPYGVVQMAGMSSDGDIFVTRPGTATNSTQAVGFNNRAIIPVGGRGNVAFGSYPLPVAYQVSPDPVTGNVLGVVKNSWYLQNILDFYGNSVCGFLCVTNGSNGIVNVVPASTQAASAVAFQNLTINNAISFGISTTADQVFTIQPVGGGGAGITNFCQGTLTATKNDSSQTSQAFIYIASGSPDFTTSLPTILIGASWSGGSPPAAVYPGITLQKTNGTQVTGKTGTGGGGDTFTSGICTTLGTPSGGTVTSITAGAGLSGGTITTSGTISLDLTHVNAWTGQQYFAEATLSISGGHVAWNLNTQQCATYAMSANTTFDNPTNMQAGSTYIMRLVYTSGTPTWSSDYKWVAAPTLTTGTWILTFYSNGSLMYGSFQGPY